MTTEKQAVRVSAFIDLGWLLDGLRGQGMPWRIDYAGLVDHIAGGRTVTGKVAYLAPYPGECYPKKETAQRELLDLLAGQGFNTRVTAMQVRGGMYLDQGIDVMLAMDMFEQAINDSYDYGHRYKPPPDATSRDRGGAKARPESRERFF